MLPILRGLVSLLLATAYVVVAVAPCQPVLEDSDERPPFTRSGERRAAWQAARAEEPATSIAAECPCGCEKKSPVRAGSGAAFALARPQAVVDLPPLAVAVDLAEPAAPIAPSLGIDPVPI